MNKTISLLSVLMLIASILVSPVSAAKPNPCQKPNHPQCVQPTPTPTTTPSPSPNVPRLLFGLGPEADQVQNDRLVSESPVNMLTSWYNGHGDLAWMGGWGDFVDGKYAQGYAMHLITWSGDSEANLNTPYGPACGRQYPLSSQFLSDMAVLADVFDGNGTTDRLYITLFTEFQTFPCSDNEWVGSENYYRTLQDQYIAALNIFHQNAPNAKVSLGWGGWQSRWNNPATGGGRSLFGYFDSVMRASDFQSFQAMQGDSNVSDVREMTRILGAYGPVMLAHYLPDGAISATQEADLRAMLTDSFLTEVNNLGLFSFSFMDPWFANESLYTFVRDAVRRYGSP